MLLAHPGLMPAYLERQGARGVHAQRLGVVTLAAQKAGLDEVAAREEMRVPIINTVDFEACAAQPDGTGRRLITPLELPRNFERSLDWPFAGFTP